MNEIYAGEIIRYFHQAINDRSHQLFELSEFVELMNPLVPMSVGRLCGKKEEFASPIIPQSRSFFDTVQVSDKELEEVKPSALLDMERPKVGTGLEVALARLKEIEEQNAAKEIELSRVEAALAAAETHDVVVEEMAEALNEEYKEEHEELAIAQVPIEPLVVEKSQSESLPLFESPAQIKKTHEDSAITALGQKEGMSLNDQMADAKPISLAEKLKLDTIPSFGAMSVNGQDSNLQSMIGFNDRFKFVSELFNSDNLAWTEAIDAIDEAGSRHAAMEIILDKLAFKFGWDMSKPVVQKFIEVVERRYS
jgi:hypothetical protein